LFNTAQDYQIDISVLDKISNKQLSKWVPFPEKEFTSFIAKCNNLSTPGPNKSCLKSIINIADVCFELGHWPSHFKVFMSIIIPKHNKESYDSSKSFRLIVFLNTIGKLIKKVIGNRFQFHSILNNFIHPSQLGSLKQRLMSDANVALTYFIHSG